MVERTFTPPVEFHGDGFVLEFRKVEDCFPRLALLLGTAAASAAARGGIAAGAAGGTGVSAGGAAGSVHCVKVRLMWWGGGWGWDRVW